MENQKTPVLKKIPFWLRSFRISKGASVSDDKEGRPASCQTKRFLRSYRRSLGSRKSEDQDDENNHESQDVTRASLMSIRKIWAEEAKTQAFCERSMSERKSKKPCSLRSKLLGSPSKIPISEKMQANQRGLQSSLNHCCYSPNKENLAPPSVAKCKSYGNQSSAGSSDGNLASEIVLSAARHAKNRRSLAREQDIWRTAVNNIGLPRTSTELGQLPQVPREQDFLELSQVMMPPRNEKHERVRDWVLCTGDSSCGISVQHSLPYAQHKHRPGHLAKEETIPKSIDCAPKVPPRTYLAKLAHAKAHLSKTAAPLANSKIPGATHNPGGAKGAVSKCAHSLSSHANQECSLLPKRAALKQQVPHERQRRLYAETGVRSQALASKHQQPKKAIRPQVHHNPGYGIDCASRVQKLSKTCSTGASDVMADDEATVLNCSCERCLTKFNAAGRQVPGRMGDFHTNYPRAMGHQAVNSCFSKNGRQAAAPSHHCECCQFNKTHEEIKDVDEKIVSSHSKPSCEKNSDKAAKCSTSNNHGFQCQDEITKVIEEAVKASIEKLLSVNANQQLNKTRSLESLHEQADRKNAATSPSKYILLSSCRSGTADSLLHSTEEPKVDSGIASFHQPCLTGGTEKEVATNGIDTVNTSSQLPQSKVTLERTASLPSLVESGSPAKVRVSTAFIKLVKRVSLGQNNDGTPSNHSSFLDVTINQRSVASQESCSQCSSGGTESCWQTAESHCAEDSCSQSEKACNSAVQDEANGSSSCTAENDQLEKNEAYNFKVQQSASIPRLVLDSPSSSIGSLSSRKPPDGWERTPPSDAPDVVDIDDDEPSELNPHTPDDAHKHFFSSDSDGSDDQHILEEVIRKGMGMTPPIKLPTRCPKLVKSPRRFKSAEVFCGKAKLKLAAYVNSGHVTVHVIRAAKLATSRGGSANAYIKVSLQPDHIKRAHWRTSVVKSSRNPEFDHKFSFELMADDAGKRLLVTAWHRDFENKRSELLGSMSFGMAKILDSDQHVRGWYRLLRQDLGMRRHFAARCSRGTCTRIKALCLD
ncbi:uncharacterized protein LOC119405600 [Rhipicephalus sanguineus]|uniref:uncharacterized protein LOC119405600 n=1 Tax=Rhipicephalus sanguineus TaxID=34632 RepID=UPI001894285E|nr:uncharacterized protein LOC119405600 [Rhipicephalus sanguineus]